MVCMSCPFKLFKLLYIQQFCMSLSIYTHTIEHYYKSRFMIIHKTLHIPQLICVLPFMNEFQVEVVSMNGFLHKVDHCALSTCFGSRDGFIGSS